MAARADVLVGLLIIGVSLIGGFTDAQLKQVVLDGKQPMPGYKGKMSDKDLEDVVAYIRALAK